MYQHYPLALKAMQVKNSSLSLCSRINMEVMMLDLEDIFRFVFGKMKDAA